MVSEEFMGPSVDSNRLTEGERVTQAMNRLGVCGGLEVPDWVEGDEEFNEEMIPDKMAAPSVPSCEVSKPYLQACSNRGLQTASQYCKCRILVDPTRALNP